MSDLDTARNDVCNWINEYRDSLSQTFFTYEGHQWDCDPVSRSNINGLLTIGLLNGGNLPTGMVWRDYNNNYVPITMAYMAELGISLGTFVTAVYSASWQHKQNVMNITTTADDVYSYDYVSTLWPDPMTQY